MERSFEIDVPAPFRLDLTVWALRRRGHNQVDGYDDGRWRRVMVTAGRTVETIVTQQAGWAEPRLLVKMTFRGSPRGGALEEKDPTSRGPLPRPRGQPGRFLPPDRTRPAPGRAGRPLLRDATTRFPTVFEAVVNAIACQQPSLTVGIHLLNRLSAAFGPAGPGRAGTFGFPSAERLAEVSPDALRPLGFSGARARANPSTTIDWRSRISRTERTAR